MRARRGREEVWQEHDQDKISARKGFKRGELVILKKGKKQQCYRVAATVQS